MNQRKANKAPTITIQSAARIRRPSAYAITPNAPNAIIKRPLASPSSPSVKFTEFAVAIITKMKIGMYHQPTSIASIPTIGMSIESNPSLLKNHHPPTAEKIVSQMSFSFALNPLVFPMPLTFKISSTAPRIPHVASVKSGIQVSFLLKSEYFVISAFWRIIEIATVSKIVPQISSPPIVGVPLFLAWSALNRLESSPESAFSLICLPILNLINCFVNQGVRASDIKNAKVPEPANITKFSIVSE